MDGKSTSGDGEGGFRELIRFTAAGYVGGLVAGWLLDALGFGRSGIGQAVVRTLSGEGESILEGWFALTRRMRGVAGSMAEAYGWGKAIGMAAPWLIDATSRFAGVDVNAVPGFYIPFFYAMSDQIGAGVAGFVHLRRRSSNLTVTVKAYLTNPVMLAGLVLILVVPLALLAGRVLGFRPTTQLQTALETILANSCWVPPLVGWISERTRG